jgi:TBC1 domain family member 6
MLSDADFFRGRGRGLRARGASALAGTGASSSNNSNKRRSLVLGACRAIDQSGGGGIIAPLTPPLNLSGAPPTASTHSRSRSVTVSPRYDSGATDKVKQVAATDDDDENRGVMTSTMKRGDEPTTDRMARFKATFSMVEPSEVLGDWVCWRCDKDDESVPPMPGDLYLSDEYLFYSAGSGRYQDVVSLVNMRALEIQCSTKRYGEPNSLTLWLELQRLRRTEGGYLSAAASSSSSSSSKKSSASATTVFQKHVLTPMRTFTDQFEVLLEVWDVDAESFDQNVTVDEISNVAYVSASVGGPGELLSQSGEAVPQLSDSGGGRLVAPIILEWFEEVAQQVHRLPLRLQPMLYRHPSMAPPIDSFSCSLNGRAGRLYVFRLYLCFVLNAEHRSHQRLMVSFAQVEAIEAAPERGIVVVTHERRLTFTELLSSSSACVQLVATAWAHDQPNKQKERDAAAAAEAAAASASTPASSSSSLASVAATSSSPTATTTTSGPAPPRQRAGSSISSPSLSSITSSAAVIVESSVAAQASSGGAGGGGRSFLDALSAHVDDSTEAELTDKYGFPLTAKDHALYAAFMPQELAAADQQKKKWQKFKSSYRLDTEIRNRSKRLRLLIRGGIPYELRAELWYKLCGAEEAHERAKALNGRTYAQLVTINSPHLRDIDKDIPRTFPNHGFFRKKENQNKLRRVLLAFSNHSSRVGYCQSLNFIAGILLLFLDEEKAFWTLTCVVSGDQEMYYHETMSGLLLDQRVLESLAARKMPQLAEHLERVGVPLQVMTTQWLMCMFVTSTPTETALRILDCYFMEGTAVILLVTLAFLRLYQTEVMALRDFADITEFVKDAARSQFDFKTLLKTAFDVVGPLDTDAVDKLRDRFRASIEHQVHMRDLDVLAMKTDFAESFVRHLLDEFNTVSSTAGTDGHISLRHFVALVPQYCQGSDQSALENVFYMFRSQDQDLISFGATVKAIHLLNKEKQRIENEAKADGSDDQSEDVSTLSNKSDDDEQQPAAANALLSRNRHLSPFDGDSSTSDDDDDDDNDEMTRQRSTIKFIPN